MKNRFILEEDTIDNSPEYAHILREKHLLLARVCQDIRTGMHLADINMPPEVGYSVLETRLGKKQASLLEGLLLVDIPSLMQPLNDFSVNGAQRFIDVRFLLEDILNLGNGSILGKNYNAILTLYNSLMDLLDQWPRT